jgi:hypothetical protein
VIPTGAATNPTSSAERPEQEVADTLSALLETWEVDHDEALNV